MDNPYDKFAVSFGIEKNMLAVSTKKIIDAYDFSLQEITGSDRDSLIIRIIEKIKADKQKIASFERSQVWETGWAENLGLYLESKGNPKALVPKFIRSGEPIRWLGKYCKTEDENFELNYVSVLRSYLLETYFSTVQSIYEFGAGTGFNLLHFGKLKPELKLFGTDFVKSSVQLMHEVSKKESINLNSSLFDMINPGKSRLEIAPNSGILTFGSLEQLGSNLLPIIDYFHGQKPEICVHIEPMIELYNPLILEDYLAAWFQGQRGYSSGLIRCIEDFEQSGKAKVVIKQRLNFGSLMMEGYNLLVWKPT